MTPPITNMAMGLLDNVTTEKEESVLRFLIFGV